jgi:hypothetical protein
MEDVIRKGSSAKIDWRRSGKSFICSFVCPYLIFLVISLLKKEKHV